MTEMLNFFNKKNEKVIWIINMQQKSFKSKSLQKQVIYTKEIQQSWVKCTEISYFAWDSGYRLHVILNIFLLLDRNSYSVITNGEK